MLANKTKANCGYYVTTISSALQNCFPFFSDFCVGPGLQQNYWQSKLIIQQKCMETTQACFSHRLGSIATIKYWVTTPKKNHVTMGTIFMHRTHNIVVVHVCIF